MLLFRRHLLMEEDGSDYFGGGWDSGSSDDYDFGSGDDYDFDFGNIQTFDDGSWLQGFDDGSILSGDLDSGFDGSLSSLPSTDDLLSIDNLPDLTLPDLAGDVSTNLSDLDADPVSAMPGMANIDTSGSGSDSNFDDLLGSDATNTTTTPTPPSNTDDLVAGNDPVIDTSTADAGGDDDVVMNPVAGHDDSVTMPDISLSPDDGDSDPMTVTAGPTTVDTSTDQDTTDSVVDHLGDGTETTMDAATDTTPDTTTDTMTAGSGGDSDPLGEFVASLDDSDPTTGNRGGDDKESIPDLGSGLMDAGDGSDLIPTDFAHNDLSDSDANTNTGDMQSGAMPFENEFAGNDEAAEPIQGPIAVDGGTEAASDAAGGGIIDQPLFVKLPTAEESAAAATGHTVQPPPPVIESDDQYVSVESVSREPVPHAASSSGSVDQFVQSAPMTEAQTQRDLAQLRAMTTSERAQVVERMNQQVESAYKQTDAAYQQQTVAHANFTESYKDYQAAVAAHGEDSAAARAGAERVAEASREYQQATERRTAVEASYNDTIARRDFVAGPAQAQLANEAMGLVNDAGLQARQGVAQQTGGEQAADMNRQSQMGARDAAIVAGAASLIASSNVPQSTASAPVTSEGGSAPASQEQVRTTTANQANAAANAGSASAASARTTDAKASDVAKTDGKSGDGKSSDGKSDSKNDSRTNDRNSSRTNNSTFSNSTSSDAPKVEVSATPAAIGSLEGLLSGGSTSDATAIIKMGSDDLGGTAESSDRTVVSVDAATDSVVEAVKSEPLASVTTVKLEDGGSRVTYADGKSQDFDASGRPATQNVEAIGDGQRQVTFANGDSIIVDDKGTPVSGQMPMANGNTVAFAGGGQVVTSPNGELVSYSSGDGQAQIVAQPDGSRVIKVGDDVSVETAKGDTFQLGSDGRPVSGTFANGNTLSTEDGVAIIRNPAGEEISRVLANGEAVSADPNADFRKSENAYRQQEQDAAREAALGSNARGATAVSNLDSKTLDAAGRDMGKTLLALQGSTSEQREASIAKIEAQANQHYQAAVGIQSDIQTKSAEIAAAKTSLDQMTSGGMADDSAEVQAQRANIAKLEGDVSALESTQKLALANYSLASNLLTAASKQDAALASASEATSFNHGPDSAFALAKAAGLSQFEWNGKQYAVVTQDQVLKAAERGLTSIEATAVRSGALDQVGVNNVKDAYVGAVTKGMYQAVTTGDALKVNTAAVDTAFKEQAQATYDRALGQYTAIMGEQNKGIAAYMAATDRMQSGESKTFGSGANAFTAVATSDDNGSMISIKKADGTTISFSRDPAAGISTVRIEGAAIPGTDVRTVVERQDGQWKTVVSSDYVAKYADAQQRADAYNANLAKSNISLSPEEQIMSGGYPQPKTAQDIMDADKRTEQFRGGVARIGDLLVDGGKAVLSVGDAAVGTVNLVASLAGTAAKGYAEMFGLGDHVDPNALAKAINSVVRVDDAKAILSSFYSADRQAENAAVQAATQTAKDGGAGFWGTAAAAGKAMIENPFVAAGSLIESSGYLLGGAAASRSVATNLLMRAGVEAGTVEAAAVLSQAQSMAQISNAGLRVAGVMSAGSTFGQLTRDGVNAQDASLAAVAVGSFTLLSGGVGHKLGVVDDFVQFGTAGMARTEAQVGLVSLARTGAAGVISLGVEGGQEGVESVFEGVMGSVARNQTINAADLGEQFGQGAALGVTQKGASGGTHNVVGLFTGSGDAHVESAPSTQSLLDGLNPTPSPAVVLPNWTANTNGVFSPTGSQDIANVTLNLGTQPVVTDQNLADVNIAHGANLDPISSPNTFNAGTVQNLNVMDGLPSALTVPTLQTTEPVILQTISQTDAESAHVADNSSLSIESLTLPTTAQVDMDSAHGAALDPIGSSNTVSVGTVQSPTIQPLTEVASTVTTTSDSSIASQVVSYNGGGIFSFNGGPTGPTHVETNVVSNVTAPTATAMTMTTSTSQETTPELNLGRVEPVLGAEVANTSPSTGRTEPVVGVVTDMSVFGDGRTEPAIGVEIADAAPSIGRAEPVMGTQTVAPLQTNSRTEPSFESPITHAESSGTLNVKLGSNVEVDLSSMEKGAQSNAGHDLASRTLQADFHQSVVDSHSPTGHQDAFEHQPSLYRNPDTGGRVDTDGHYTPGRDGRAALIDIQQIVSGTSHVGQMMTDPAVLGLQVQAFVSNVMNDATQIAKSGDAASAGRVRGEAAQFLSNQRQALVDNLTVNRSQLSSPEFQNQVVTANANVASLDAAISQLMTAVVPAGTQLTQDGVETKSKQTESKQNSKSENTQAQAHTQTATNPKPGLPPAATEVVAKPVAAVTPQASTAVAAVPSPVPQTRADMAKAIQQVAASPQSVLSPQALSSVVENVRGMIDSVTDEMSSLMADGNLEKAERLHTQAVQFLTQQMQTLVANGNQALSAEMAQAHQVGMQGSFNADPELIAKGHAMVDAVNTQAQSIQSQIAEIKQRISDLQARPPKQIIPANWGQDLQTQAPTPVASEPAMVAPSTNNVSVDPIQSSLAKFQENFPGATIETQEKQEFKGTRYFESEFKAADGSQIGRMEFTIDQDGQMYMERLDVWDAQGKGVSKAAFASILSEHPEITSIKAGTLQDSNMEAYSQAYAETKNMEAAIKATPAYKVRALMGFTELEFNPMLTGTPEFVSRRPAGAEISPAVPAAAPTVESAPVSYNGAVTFTTESGKTVTLPQRPVAVEQAMSQMAARVMAESGDSEFERQFVGVAMAGERANMIDRDMKVPPRERQIQFPDFGGPSVDGQISIVNHLAGNNSFSGHGGNIASLVGENVAIAAGFARHQGVDIYPTERLFNQRMDHLNQYLPADQQIRTRFYTPESTEQRVESKEYTLRYLNDHQLPMSSLSDESLHDVNAHATRQMTIPQELENHFIDQHRAIVGFLAHLQVATPLSTNLERIAESVWNNVGSRIDSFTAGAPGMLAVSEDASRIPAAIAGFMDPKSIAGISTRSVVDEVRNFFESSVVGRDLSYTQKQALENYLTTLSQEPSNTQTLEIGHLENKVLERLAALQEAAPQVLEDLAAGKQFEAPVQTALTEPSVVEAEIFGGGAPNGSLDSHGASQEGINRAAQMSAYRVNPNGEVIPMKTVDWADMEVPAGVAIVVQGASGAPYVWNGGGNADVNQRMVDQVQNYLTKSETAAEKAATANANRLADAQDVGELVLDADMTGLSTEDILNDLHSEMPASVPTATVLELSVEEFHQMMVSGEATSAPALPGAEVTDHAPSMNAYQANKQLGIADTTSTAKNLAMTAGDAQSALAILDRVPAAKAEAALASAKDQLMAIESAKARHPGTETDYTNRIENQIRDKVNELQTKFNRSVETLEANAVLHQVQADNRLTNMTQFQGLSTQKLADLREQVLDVSQNVQQQGAGRDLINQALSCIDQAIEVNLQAEVTRVAKAVADGARQKSNNEFRAKQEFDSRSKLEGADAMGRPLDANQIREIRQATELAKQDLSALTAQQALFIQNAHNMLEEKEAYQGKQFQGLRSADQKIAEPLKVALADLQKRLNMAAASDSAMSVAEAQGRALTGGPKHAVNGTDQFGNYMRREMISSRGAEMRRDVDEITRALRQLAPSDSFNSEIANAGSAGHVRMAMPVLTSQSDLNAVLNFFANQNIPVTTHQVLGANRISTLGSSKVGEAPNSFAQAQKVFDAINQLQAGAVATQPIDGPVQRFVVSMSAHMDNYIPAHLQALIDGEPVHIPLSQSVPPVQQTTPAGLGTVNATEASQIRDVISKMNGNPAELKAADAAQIKQLRDRLNSAESLSPAEREISKLVNQAWNLVGETYQKQLNNDPGLALAKAQGRGVEADFVAAQDVGLVKPSSELKTAIQDAMAALDIVSGAGPQQLVNREIQGLIANGNMRFSMPALQTQEEVTAVRDFFASHGMTVDDKVILAANRLSMLATMRIEDAKNSFQDAQPLFKVMQTLPSHEIAKISATSPEGQLIQNMLVHLNHHIATDVQKQVASATGGTGAADATVVHSSPAFEGEDRRSNAGLEPQFERMSEVQMPGLPEGLKVYENRAANGEKFLTFQYVVQVEGQLKVKESILPIDPLTQMIDATLPSGKKFAELWITANGGQAHAIFADVGNLGFVNKEMAGQREAGDAYLTSTANMIRAVTGENSVSFKWGGDELVTFTTEKDSMKVQAMAQAISDGVHAPDIHKIFLDEKKVRAEAVRAEIYGKFPAADPRAYQTAVANAGSEEEKAKLTAEHKQARALMASSGIFDIYKSFPAAKPETYRMAMAEIGKRELAMTPDERAQNAANLAQERTELTEKFERAQAEMRSSSLYMSRTATTDFKEKFVPYSRETISVGVTAIGVGDSKENVLLRSEGQATLVKREVKEHMNQDASKYLGSEPSADRKIESTWEPTILMPSSAPATDAAPTGLRAVTPDLPLVTEERIGQIGRFDRFDVGVYQDEIGNISYKLEDYLTDASGKRQVVHYEVPLNGNTGFMDANNVHAERVLRAVVEEQAPQGLVMLDAWILQKVNYFAAGTGAGDLFLESVGKAISSVLEKENLPFKLAGPKFLLEVGQTNLTAFENSVEKALENSAEIKQMFADQRAYLEAMLETNPNDKELQGHLRTLNDLETHSLVLISSLRTETGNRLEDVKKKMSDDISAQEKVAKAEATARLLQAANQAEAGEETPPKKAAGD